MNGNASQPTPRMLDGWAYDLATIGREPHLIRDVLELRSTAWLVGPSGSYKSFTALSMAIAVATGRPWYGRETHAGSVVYICSEGSRAWGRRVAAYAQVYGLPDIRHDLWMIPAPVQIGSPDWVALAAALEQIRPALVVIDTQAQCSTEYEENSNSDMARVCAHLSRLAQMTGATVLTVHHSGHGRDGQGIRARGASSIYAAADTELTVIPKTDHADGVSLPYVELTASKQKDLVGGRLVTLAPHVVSLDGATDYYGRPVTSVVMVPFEPAETEAEPTPEQWAARLYSAGITEPMGRDRLTAAAADAGIELPGSTATRAEITRAHRAHCARHGHPKLTTV